MSTNYKNHAQELQEAINQYIDSIDYKLISLSKISSIYGENHINPLKLKRIQLQELSLKLQNNPINIEKIAIEIKEILTSDRII